MKEKEEIRKKVKTMAASRYGKQSLKKTHDSKKICEEKQKKKKTNRFPYMLRALH